MKLQGKQNLTDVDQLDEQPSTNADVDALIADNTRLQHEITLALQSKAAQVAAAAELEARIFDMSQQLQRQQKHMADCEDALAVAVRQQEKQESELVIARQQLSDKVEEVLALTVKLVDLQKQDEAAKTQLRDLVQQQLRQLDQMAAREDALASVTAREEDLERRLTQAQGEATEKRAEVLTLTSALIALQKDFDVAKKKADKFPALMQTLRALEDQVAEIRSSTSWRVTMPLRKAKDGVRYLNPLRR